MELELLQLAVTHTLATNAGSWALTQRHPRQSNGNLKQQSAQSLHELQTGSRQKRLNRRGANRPTDVATLPFASASAGGASAQFSQQGSVRPRAAAPDAWVLAPHGSSSRSWAGPRRSQQDTLRKPTLRAGQPPTESCSQSASEETASTGSAGLSRWRIPPGQTSATETLVEWHLDDEPVTGQQAGAGGSRGGIASMAAAASAAAGRLFGRGGRGDPDGADAAGPNGGWGPASGAGAAPLQWPPGGGGGATPILVGEHAVGADGLGGGQAAGGGLGSRPAAAAAAALTSAGGALGGLAEAAVDVPVRGLRQLNRAVTAGVSDFLASDPGRRLSEQMAAEMSTGALMAPVYLTEELVKARLRSLLRSHARWALTFVAVRVSVATAMLHCAKGLLRRSVRERGPRWLRCSVRFLVDVMLPTGFFGPLLGVTAAVLQLAGVSLTGLLLHRGGGGGGITDALTSSNPAALAAAALPAVAAVAGDAVAATVAATVSPVASAASALAGGGGGGSSSQ